MVTIRIWEVVVDINLVGLWLKFGNFEKLDSWVDRILIVWPGMIRISLAQDLKAEFVVGCIVPDDLHKFLRRFLSNFGQHWILH